MPNFITFSQAVEQKFNEMSKNELYVTVQDKDLMWSVYLGSFPEGTDPLFRVNTEHNCSCCRNFVKNIGNVVAIENNKLTSVWDIEGLPYPYNQVAKVLHNLVVHTAISGLFRTKERQYGASHTFEAVPNLSPKKWNHFVGYVQNKHYTRDVDAVRGQYATAVQTLKRALEELTEESVDTVVSLINEGSLYRGKQYLKTVQVFRAMQDSYKQLTKEQKDIFLWQNASGPVAGIRNTSIGTLLQDLSEGVDLEKAVKSYEIKVAPANYKRTTALITPRMVEDAMKTINALGLEPALERRFAKLSDVSVNNVLWVDNSVQAKMKDGIKDLLMDVAKASVPTDPSKLKTEDITIDDFVKKVLPNATSMEVLFKNKNVSNLVSITAPVHDDANSLFKWNNNFAWSYNGNIADSDIRKAVQSLGGRVDGVFRFSHSWNYDKRNASLMDLHVFMPGSDMAVESGVNDSYGNRQRVGWNQRKHLESGGVQDVDYTSPAPEGYIPVENITFPLLKTMPEGQYICKVHNWNWRPPTNGGFRAEIEFDGQIFEYEHIEPLKHKQWVTVATVTLKNGAFSINHHLPCNASSQAKWNINTERFVKVTSVMNSPNYWNENQVGHKHWFFMLDGCINDEPTRGIYNEFLKSELDKHRKVFEVVGTKTMCPKANEQLSGIGFTSARNDQVTVAVTGKKLNKLYNIKF